MFDVCKTITFGCVIAILILSVIILTKVDKKEPYDVEGSVKHGKNIEKCIDRCRMQGEDSSANIADCTMKCLN